MRKILILTACMLCIACMHTFAQTLNCKKFKNGTFKTSYDGIIDTVIRNGALQTELTNSAHKGSFNVKWIDECTYTLTPTAETLNEQPDLPNGVVTVKITAIDKNTCKQTITSTFSAQVITMDVEKIK